MSLLDLIDQSLIGRADTPAIDVETGGQRTQFSFGELESRSNGWAQWLVQQGIAPGDRVAFLLGNRKIEGQRKARYVSKVAIFDDRRSTVPKLIAFWVVSPTFRHRLGRSTEHFRMFL